MITAELDDLNILNLYILNEMVRKQIHNPK